MIERDRSTYIGASEAAAVIGLSRWGTPFSVWARKVGLRPEQPPKLRFYIGQALEPTLLELYEARIGKRPRRHQRLVIAKSHPFIGAHPDYVRLEVKTSRDDTGWGPDGSTMTDWEPGIIPIDYYLQVEHQLFVTGWSFSDVAVLIGHEEFRTYTVRRSPGTITGLVNAETEFWNTYVIPNTPPPLDDSEEAQAYLRSTYPRAREPLAIATEAEATLMRQVRDARDAAKAAEVEKDRAEARLEGLIGHREGVTDGRLRATWKEQGTSSLDAAKLRELLGAIDRADIIDAATRKGTTRVLRVNPIRTEA